MASSIPCLVESMAYIPGHHVFSVNPFAGYILVKLIVERIGVIAELPCMVPECPQIGLGEGICNPVGRPRDNRPSRSCAPVQDAPHPEKRWVFHTGGFNRQSSPEVGEQKRFLHRIVRSTIDVEVKAPIDVMGVINGATGGNGASRHQKTGFDSTVLAEMPFLDIPI